MALLNTDEQYYPEGSGGLGEGELGYYQFVTLTDLINNFMFEKTGEGTRIGAMNRNRVAYAAQRAIQEFNYDILKVTTSLVIEVDASKNLIILPQDFVSEVGCSSLDNLGQKHPLLRTWRTTPGQDPTLDDELLYTFDDNGDLLVETPGYNLNQFNTQIRGEINQAQQDYTGYVYGSVYNDYEYPYAGGYYKRFGAQGEDLNSNGTYQIDETQGILYLSGSFYNEGADDLNTPQSSYFQLDYITDGLGKDESDIKVHKLVEEAVYLEMETRILSNADSIPEYVINRVDKKRRAKTRNSKLRLQRLKFGELAQVFRQQSVWIKH